MRKSFLLIVMFGFLTGGSWAQRTCGTMEHLQMQLQQDPSMAQRMQQIETFTQNWIANHTADERSTITIPVVVHVVYKTTAQNISDAQVQAQINQLNDDYARLNSDAGNTPSVFVPVAANCEVQFCLAQRDPSGNATNGIIHKVTTTTSFSSNDNIKKSATGGDDAWDRNSYLNLWTGNLSGGLLGYAQFPGGPAATDGVVVLYSSVGSIASPGTELHYDLGRTATHEIGHWLNLFHIWGDDGTACTGSDQVADTPNQAGATFGCPSFPQISCSNGPNGNMFMNYMDYSDDDCMNIFTAGQKARMQALFVSGGSRFSITTSQGCVPPIVGCTDAFEPNNSKGSAKPITVGVSIVALISTATDKDFFSFANSSGQPNIKVTLTNLPANYDLKLFNSSGVSVAASHNGGTADENIIFNSAPVGTYKPEVLGKNGAFNATQCYTLTAFISNTPFKLGDGDQMNPNSTVNNLSNIYPNPSNGRVTVDYSSATDGDVNLVVFDLMGKMVHNQTVTANQGLNSFNFDYTDLQPGIYMLEVINGSEVKKMKFEISK